MKKQISVMIKAVLLPGLFLLMILPASAQRDKGGSLITQDQINKITELVKPLRDQIEKRISGNPTYNAYVEDLKQIHAATSLKQKNALTNQLEAKYTGFFKEIWSASQVDEQGYQLKIRKIFPDNLGSLLQFDPYLAFSLSVSTSTVKPAEPPPLAPDKCLDVCGIAAGEIVGASNLVAGAGGNYGNCFLITSAWGTGAFFYGKSEVNGYLRNGISIPGTLPSDSRKLRFTKRYELKQEGVSFAVLGGGFAETRSQTYQSSEYLLVFSPIIWGSHAVKMKTMTQNYLLEKKDVALSQFHNYASTVALYGSGNWCISECTGIKWTVCEER